MRAIKAFFDGKVIRLPKGFTHKPTEVIVMIQEDEEIYLKASEIELAKIWENEEDAVYDKI